MSIVVTTARKATLGRDGLALVVVFVACSGAPVTTQDESATTTSGAATSATSGGTSTPTTDGETSGCAFLCEPDGGLGCGSGESECCDPFLQDCPDGEKCNAWSPDGASAWNANKCVPIDPEPDAVGEECTVVGNGLSGLDSCDAGAMCWDVDPDDNSGTCVPLCVGDWDQCTMAPSSCCPPWSNCTISGGGYLIVCLATCHPLLHDCEFPGEYCYPVEDASQCAPDASGDGGQPGDPCEYINACDPGTYCGDPSTYPGCDLEADGCCVPFCDLGAPECIAGSECQPYIDPNDTPAGFEDLGACVIP